MANLSLLNKTVTYFAMPVPFSFNPHNRSSHQRYSIKVFLKTWCWSLFFNKNAGLRPAILLRRNSNTGVFLWILQSFKYTFFHRTPPVAASVTTKSKRKPLNLYQIRKYFTINICYIWAKNELPYLPQSITTEKISKYPFP